MKKEYVLNRINLLLARHNAHVMDGRHVSGSRYEIYARVDGLFYGLFIVDEDEEPTQKMIDKCKELNDAGSWGYVVRPSGLQKLVAIIDQNWYFSDIVLEEKEGAA